MSETSIPEIVNSPEYQIKDALADAIMVTYKGIIQNKYSEDFAGEHYGRKPKNFDELTEFIDKKKLGIGEVLSSGTLEKCYEASLRAAYYLGMNRSDLFSKIFLLNGQKTEDSKFKNGYDHHYIMCTQATNGKFYAISPDNYKLSETYGGAINNMLEIIEADDMEGLVSKIEGIEGGSWPYARDIVGFDLSYIKSERFLSPEDERSGIKKNLLTIPVIYKKKNRDGLEQHILKSADVFAKGGEFYSWMDLYENVM